MRKILQKTKKKQKIPLDVKINILVYVIINLGLFFLNWIDTSYYWFVWCATGWGIGLLMYLSIRFITRKKRSGSSTGFLIHLSVYIIMTLYFLYLDMFTGRDLSNPITWAFFPISAWGTLLFSHFLSMLFIQIREKPEEPRARKRYTLFNAFIAHLFIFLCANKYMLIVNLLTGFDTKWYLYPLGGTLLALAIHLIVTILELIPIKNLQLKILLYHLFIFIVVCAYIIFDDWLSTGGLYWYWPVGGWSLGILLHLIYYYVVQVVRRKKSN
ncbi:MAG: 2TM domain-containing protein [Promethearchaeota archaeon]|nr:MAG: 2TM domain-containing protein [Candidatus Lokiarchaeota archaeon]